jgi:precorrin-2/cobalt-factor-2 C20-methyltransferase
MVHRQTMSSGKLYGVGVGPGDPELVTLKAARLISNAEVLAYLSANGGESIARSIAEPHIRAGTQELVFDVPMRLEVEFAERSYDAAAIALAECLNKGADVVMLCEGDPLFYGSFMYILDRLKSAFEVIVVPGITSMTAVAAELGQPLARRNEIVKVLPGTVDEERLEDELKEGGPAVVIKVGRHFNKVKTVLQRLGRERDCTVVEWATQIDQRIRPMHLIEELNLPYFSTILVRGKAESA